VARALGRKRIDGDAGHLSNDFEGERADIEMAFVRILSVGGLVLASADVAAIDKKERIRIAILKHNLKDSPFDATRTFGEAYLICYRTSVEKRRIVRDDYGRPTNRPVPAEEFDDDLDDEAS
jgi:hypothetical protein